MFWLGGIGQLPELAPSDKYQTRTSFSTFYGINSCKSLDGISLWVRKRIRLRAEVFWSNRRLIKVELESPIE
jgi:hypothetical protein